MSDVDQDAEPISESAESVPLEPLVVETEWQPFLSRWIVTLTADGIGWQRWGKDDAQWVPWRLVGGLENGMRGGRTPTTKILALDGSSLGSIDGAFLRYETKATLAHIVAVFRPDLFVGVEGNVWGVLGGCIRREVAAAEVEAEVEAEADRSRGLRDGESAPNEA